MDVMGDPFGLRDEDCGKCIIEERRKSQQSVRADEFQAALDSPFLQQALSTFETMTPGYQHSIDPAAQTCCFQRRCQW
jgi:hypothetical protein